jgi:uncharacterized protein YcgL (UPF0745 family)
MRPSAFSEIVFGHFLENIGKPYEMARFPLGPARLLQNAECAKVAQSSRLAGIQIMLELKPSKGL